MNITRRNDQNERAIPHTKPIRTNSKSTTKRMRLLRVPNPEHMLTGVHDNVLSSIVVDIKHYDLLFTLPTSLKTE